MLQVIQDSGQSGPFQIWALAIDGVGRERSDVEEGT
jgi:hypothetical protein